MTDETVDCFNCGSANPEWAQVCRSCGVVLRHGEARVMPAGRVPTDRDSLVSIGAVVGTILAALLIGLFVAGLNPTEPSVGRETASPSPTEEPSREASTPPVATDTPAPTPTATPPLPGTITFGTTLDANRQVTDPTDTFTPGMLLAYSVAMPATFGGEQFSNEISRVQDGQETVVLPKDPVNVTPTATVVGFNLGEAGAFFADLGGPGEYVWRVYVNDQLVAQGPIRLAEG